MRVNFEVLDVSRPPCGWARGHDSLHGDARGEISAKFLITGVLGPHANAHGPNEFLHIEYAKTLTAAMAAVSAAQATQIGV